MSEIHPVLSGSPTDSTGEGTAQLPPVQVVSPQPSSAAAVTGLKDPLLRSPRHSSIVLCLALGLFFCLAAVGTWWFAVRTVVGQQYDDLVWDTLKDGFPRHLAPLVDFFTHSTYVIGVIIILGIVSVVVVILRRRWLLLVQLVAFALAAFLVGFLAKRLLPRPRLDPALANPANSSPSGHSVAAFTAAVVLVLAVPLAARAVAAVVATIFAASVGLSVVVGQWHRPSDVIVAFLMVTGLALLTMAFTRASGMDKLGARRSSASIQVISTLMIAVGACASLFSLYLFWQILPGVEQEVAWTVAAAQGSAILAICGIASLGLGLVLALRQVTASPLSAIGLVGAPPAPPAAPAFALDDSAAL